MGPPQCPHGRNGSNWHNCPRVHDYECGGNFFECSVFCWIFGEAEMEKYTNNYIKDRKELDFWSRFGKIEEYVCHVWSFSGIFWYSRLQNMNIYIQMMNLSSTRDSGGPLLEPKQAYECRSYMTPRVVVIWLQMWAYYCECGLGPNGPAAMSPWAQWV